MNRYLTIAIAVVCALALCIPVGVLANGAKPPASTGTGAVTVTPPVGRGPGEANIPAAIQQRGYVTNMCEAQQAMEALVAASGGQTVTGDYRVAYMIDPPRGWYQPTNGSLTWRAPAAGETVHLEAVIMDALTGQMLPVTGVTMDVLDQQGKTVQSQPLNYLWHPMASHFGNNFSIPTAGTYSLRVRAPVPLIWRHDAKLGNRFTSPVDVTFDNVQITPKQAPPEEKGPAAGGGAGAGPGTITVPEGQPCPPGTQPASNQPKSNTY